MENTSLLLSQLFVSYAAFDAANVDLTAASIAAFHRHHNITPEDWAAARAQPQLELNGTRTFLGQALAECRRVAGGGWRPRVPALPRQLRIDNTTGFFVDAATAQPYFLSGYNEAPKPSLANATEALTCGIEKTDIGVSCGWLVPEDGNASMARVQTYIDSLDILAQIGQHGTLFLGNGRQGSSSAPEDQMMPQWAAAKYPGLTTDTGRQHFCSFDIDNPGARDVFGQALNALIPAVVNHPAVFSVSLANEPGFPAANSSYTLRKFQAWLQAAYAGRIEDLNRAWNNSPGFANFSDPAMAPAMGYRTFSNAQLLDWAAFNRERVTAWYRFLYDTIQAAAARGSGGRKRLAVHMKINNDGQPFGRAHTDGIDRPRLSEFYELHGCDTRALASSESHFSFPQYPPNFYAFDWLSVSGSYSFMRSLDPSKPVIESEWHTVSTVTFRTPELSPQHMSACAVLAHCHGLASNEIWYWGRKDWLPNSTVSKEFGGADFAFSLSAQAQAFNAYLRTHAEANALAADIVAVATQPMRMLMLYSDASAVVDTNYLNVQLATFSLLEFVGVNLGFVPEPRLPGSSLLTSADLLVVPAVSHASDNTVAAVKALAERSSRHGGIRAGDGPQVLLVSVNATDRASVFAFDNRSRPRDPASLQWLRSLPAVEIGDVADAQAFARVEAAVLAAGRMSRAFRCVQAANTSATAFGVFARFATGSSVADGQGRAVVLNTVNATQQVTLIDSRTQAGVGSLRNAWTGEPVSLPLTLAPLEHLFLTFTS